MFTKHIVDFQFTEFFSSTVSFLNINLFIYFFLAVLGFLSLQRAVSTLQLWCTGFSLRWLLLLQGRARVLGFR